jgi:hypothetical protein
MDPFSIFVLVTSIFAGGASYVQARKAAKAAKKAADQNRGALLNKESNVEPISVIYGTRRVGGVRVFVSTEGKEAPAGGYYGYYDPDTDIYLDDGGVGFSTPTNEYLYIALVLCEGPVESISDIYIDDIPSSDSRFTGYVTIQSFTGADDQAASSILRTVNEYWTADHRLRGVAYLAVRLKYNPDVFSGIPDITALVQGKKVYDPREVSHDPDDSSTWAYSNNPSLCLLDYLTNSRFGKGLPMSAIDEAAFIEAANDCDSSVTEYSGGTTGKLFECNAVLSTGETLFDNVNRILIGCRGFMPYSQGVYQLKIDKSRSTVMDFDINNIIGGITIRGETKEDKFNRIIAKFANPDNSWQTDVVFWPLEGSTEETTFLAEDGGILLQDEIDFETITNYYQARDLARIFVLRSRNALKCAFQCTSDALQLSVADIITVTHATPGWTSKPFQVEEIGINTDGTCALSLIEYDSTIYTWEVGTEQSTYPDSYLPNPYLVGPISNLTITESTFVNSDGTVMVQADVEWDAPVDGNVVQYELQVKKTADPDTAYISVFSTTTKYTFTSANSGINYTLRVRSINALGVKSDWISTTATIDGKTDNPNGATGLTATGGIESIKLTWANPVDKDIGAVVVYRNTTNNSGTSSEIARILGTAFIDAGLPESTTYYYWLKIADTTGNLSAFSTGASATTSATPADGLDGARNAQVYFFYNTAQGSAPTAPTTAQVSYNFSTQTASISASGWSVTLNPAALSDDDTGNNKYWAVKVVFQENTFGGSYSETISSVFPWMNFDGLVTFTNLSNATNENGSGITYIDGGAIIADTLSINSIATNTSKGWGNFYFEIGTTASVAGWTGAGLFRCASSATFGIGGLASAANSTAVGAQQEGNNSTSWGGIFLNSTVLGGTTHRAYAQLANNSTGATIGESTGNLAYIANATYAVQTTGDVYVDGDITATGTISPFTGMHDALMDDTDTPDIGDIFVDTAVVIKRDISNTLCNVSESSQTGQVAIGVYAGDRAGSYVPVAARSVSYPEIGENGLPTGNTTYSIAAEYQQYFTSKKTVVINALGEGQINVCGENGDIQAGDLIVTSSFSGKGMRQFDDIIRASTVARAREAASFTGAEIKQIACIYLCG